MRVDAIACKHLQFHAIVCNSVQTFAIVCNSLQLQYPDGHAIMLSSERVRGAHAGVSCCIRRLVMTDQQMQITWAPIDDIRPYEQNPKHHSEESINVIAASRELLFMPKE